MNEYQQTLVEWLKKIGISNKKILSAIAHVPRDIFVPEELKSYAYEDEALPIECNQTISQPFVVARMTELIVEQNVLNSVLEIGTGSGYQAAILGQLFKAVYSVERIHFLLDKAVQRFQTLHYSNIHTKFADGFEGWEEHAPYNAIMVTAAAPEIPQSLLDQMAEGGRMIIPVGLPSTGQRLHRVVRSGDEYNIEILDAVVFVPMLPGTKD